jgi:hypothetical protein
MPSFDLESTGAASVGCAAALTAWVLIARRSQKRSGDRPSLDFRFKRDPKNRRLYVQLSRKGDNTE